MGNLKYWVSPKRILGNLDVQIICSYLQSFVIQWNSYMEQVEFQVCETQFYKGECDDDNDESEGVDC